jgi:hypothetical protein
MVGAGSKVAAVGGYLVARYALIMQIKEIIEAKTSARRWRRVLNW